MFHRIQQVEARLIHQDHDARHGEGLGHGRYAKDRIGAHGDLGLTILVADGFQARDVAMPRHDGDETGRRAFVDVCFHFGGDSSQPNRVHAGRGGVGFFGGKHIGGIGRKCAYQES